MDYPELFRKRIIPEECVHLKDDEILFLSDDILVTKWHALKPKKELHHGYSCYFPKRGYKISKFYRANGELLYWYCDIIDVSIDRAANTFTATDLLADVIVYPDGFVKVVDLGELVEAYNENGIDMKQFKNAILRLNDLLETIYAGKEGAFKACKDLIEQFEVE